jgi:hypothetical protein
MTRLFQGVRLANGNCRACPAGDSHKIFLEFQGETGLKYQDSRVPGKFTHPQNQGYA